MDLNKAYQLISHKIITWINDFVRLLPNILVAALLIVIGIYAAKLIKKIASNLIQRVSDKPRAK